MGCSNTKSVESANEALHQSQQTRQPNNNYAVFANNYINILQKHNPISNVKVIFKIHHLLLFACKSGSQHILNNHTYYIWHDQYVRDTDKGSKYYFVLSDEPFRFYDIQESMYSLFVLLGIETKTKNVYNDYRHGFMLNACYLNVECYELNRVVKTIANERMNVLRQQQEIYGDGAIMFATNRMQEISQNIDDYKNILETCDKKEAIAIITEYDKLVADHAKYKNLIEESKKAENNAESLAKSIATLQNLVNALVVDADDVVDIEQVIQEVQPVVATSAFAVPIVNVGVVERVAKG